VSRFELDYDMPEKTAPRAVIAKLALADDEKRESINSLGIYRVEARFYRELASASGMATPETYFVEYDAGYVNLLLEDLGHLRAVDQADDCSFEDASAGLSALATMHAMWWEDPRLPGYSWLPGSPGSEQIRVQVERFPGSLESCLENVGDYLPSGFAAIARMCGKSIPEITRLNYRGPLTLTHGDFRLANLFFDDAVGTANRVIALDWQLVGHAQGASDVGYFLCWSLETESRRRYEKQLLTDYHDCLIDLGLSGYSYDEFIVDARRAVLKNLRIIVSVSGSSFGDDLLATDDGR
ncbi:MAG: phosphotransferase, partial [Chloroflexi bacterium]|nr:phosphotransferase [Chloroflexota bacterium]